MEFCDSVIEFCDSVIEFYQFCSKFGERDGHGESRNGHGKVMEKSRENILSSLWEPCIAFSKMHVPGRVLEINV